MQMTRLETFTDAAFAFAVTMLVIAAQQIPDNIASLLAAFRNVPTFVSSIAVLGIFLVGPLVVEPALRSGRCRFHPGLYLPVKDNFRAMWFLLSDGRVGQALALHTTERQARQLFALYALVIIAVSAEVLLLNLRAWQLRESLRLNAREKNDACGTNGLEHSGERGDCIAGVVSEFADRTNRMERLGLFLHGDSGAAAPFLLQPSTESE
jgi:hypothetical protein